MIRASNKEKLMSALARSWASVFVLVLCAFLALATAPAPAGWLQYTYTEMTTPGGHDFTATGLNNLGDVCGNYRKEIDLGYGPQTISVAYASINGATQPLAYQRPTGNLVARSINDSRIVVGESDREDPVYHYYDHLPAVWTTPAAYAFISSFSPTGEAQAFHINNSNQIALRAVVSNTPSAVYNYGAGAPAIIDITGFNTSNVVDVSDNHVFSGSAYQNGTGNRFGVIGALNGAGQVQSVTTFTAFGAGGATQLDAVNNNGVGVGMAVFGGSSLYRAYLRYADGSCINLGGDTSTWSYATDINDKAQVAGVIKGAGGNGTAGLFRPGQAALTLNDYVVALPSDWSLNEAVGINNKGQIIANATDSGGHKHALLLSPVTYNSILDGGFNSGELLWNKIPGGVGATAFLASDPLNAANTVVQFTTGSPMTITQQVTTPYEAFAVEFKYLLPAATGTLTVRIDNSVIGAIDGTAQQTGQWLSGWFVVADSNLEGLLTAQLAFTYDAAGGNTIYLDDIAMTAPEPASLGLLAAGAGLLLRRRVR
jgi:hypothetical protein